MSKKDTKNQEIFHNLCAETLKDRGDLMAMGIKELQALKRGLQAVQMDFMARYGKGHSLLVKHFADVDVAILLKQSQKDG